MVIARKNIAPTSTKGYSEPVASIYLKNGATDEKAELFIIEEAVSEDSASVTYIATDAKSRKYTVNEFYPTDVKLKRREDNVLAVAVRTKAAAAEFAEQCDTFTKKYTVLDNLIRNNGENAKFRAFIPSFRIMYACDANGKSVSGSTVYIVTEIREAVPYDSFIDDLKANPGRNPERRLLTHQSLLITLAECLRIFYKSNELRLDLDRAVFGIPKKQRDIPTETLMLMNFDAISLHSYEFVRESELLKQQEESEADKNAQTVPAEETQEVAEAPAEIPEEPVIAAEEALQEAAAEPVTEITQEPAPTEEISAEEQSPEIAAETAPTATAVTPATEKEEPVTQEEAAAETEDKEGEPPEEPEVKAEEKAEAPAETETAADNKAEAPAEETEKPATEVTEEKTEPVSEVKAEEISEKETEEKPAEENNGLKAETPAEEIKDNGNTDIKPDFNKQNGNKQKWDNRNRQNGNRNRNSNNGQNQADKPENKPVEKKDAPKQENKPAEKKDAPKQENKPAEKKDAPKQENKPAEKPAVKTIPGGSYGRIDAPAVAVRAENKTAANKEPAKTEANVKSFGRIDIPNTKPAEKTEFQAQAGKPHTEKPADSPSVKSFGKIEIPVKKTEAPKQESKTEEKKEAPKQENKPAEKKQAPKQENKPAEKKQAPKQENKPAEKKQAPKQENKPAEKKQAPKQENKPAEKKQAPKQENKPAEKKQPPKQENKPAEKKQAPKQESKPAEKKQAPKQESKPAEKKQAPKQENKPAEEKTSPKKETKTAEIKEKIKTENTQKKAAPKTAKKDSPKPEAKKSSKKKEAPKTADLCFVPGDLEEVLTIEGPEEMLVSPEMDKAIMDDIRFIIGKLAAVIPEGGTADTSEILMGGIRTATPGYRSEFNAVIESVKKDSPDAPQNLDELSALLWEMRSQAFPDEISKEFDLTGIVPVKKLEKLTSLLDRKRDYPVETSFRAMLADKPVYGKHNGTDDIEVLIIGNDTVMGRFYGAITENGVFADRHLNIEVLAEDADIQEIMIRSWLPALTDAGISDICTFTFTECDCTADSVKEKLKEKSRNAIFVCFGNSEKTAEITKAAVSNAGDATVYAVTQDSEPFKSVRKAAIFDISDTSAWDKTIKFSQTVLKNTEEFLSSLEVQHTDIMTVPGQAHNELHLLWEARDYAAALNAGMSDDGIAAAIENAMKGDGCGNLVRMRHRKWVMKMVCEGWTRMQPSVSSFPYSDINTKAKTHIAICDCLATPPKSADELAKLYIQKKLTDKTEVYYSTYHKNVTSNNANEVTAKRFAEASDRAAWLLQEDKTCSLEFIGLRNIVEGARAKKSISDREFYRQYNLLLEHAKYLPEEKYALLEDLLESIKDIFTSSMGTGTYLTYKQRHALAIGAIPEILTKKAKIRLAIPFGTNPGADIFGSPAQVTAAKADSALMLIYAEDGNELIAAAGTAIKSVSAIGTGKASLSAVAFTLSEKLTEEQKAVFTDTLRKSGMFEGVTVKTCSEEAEICELAADTVAQANVTATEKNGSMLSIMLRGCGFYAKNPHYTYNSLTGNFENLSGCDFLKYIDAAAHVDVKHMLDGMNAGDVQSVARQFFSENTTLWDFYRNKPRAWKKFCELADNYNSRTGIVLELRLTDVIWKKATATRKYTYFLPGYTFDATRKLLDGLYRSDIITDSLYMVHWYTDDTVEVVFTSYEYFAQVLDDFFTDTGRLQSADRIEVFNIRRNVYVKYDSLNVENVVPEAEYRKCVEQNTWAGLTEVLEKLADELGFIRQLKIENNVISYRYASHDIKRLLVSAGSLLENYVCIKCLESGLFDDVRSNVVVSWDKNIPELQNEFDVVITRGCKSMFIECKARRDLNQDFYYKLSCLTHKFGINAKAVVVADTEDTEGTVTPDNEIQRKRGKALGVETVFRKEELDNIAQVLSDLMDN